jgi:hypothetical protein
MTTVTIHETPSAKIIKDANAIETITAGDMTIGLQRPGVLAQYRIVEAVGASAAKNEVYMGMIMPLIHVVSINGTPAPAPSNKSQVEALISRLGEEGIGAVMVHLQGKAETANQEDAVKN